MTKHEACPVAAGPRLDRLEDQWDKLSETLVESSSALARIDERTENMQVAIAHTAELEKRIRKVESWVWKGIGGLSVLSVVVSLAAKMWL